MALPGFRKRKSAAGAEVKDGPSAESQLSAKRATKTRRNAIIVTSIFYLLSVIFLILVEIGNTNGSRVRGDIYFFRLNLANIMPSSVSGMNGLSLTNSIARTLGLHDFYQVGLWNFCEGYEDEGITYCSTPENLYWFNPVEILKSELLAGATIALPNEVNTVLTILRIASQVMFGFFLSTLVLNFCLMLTTPIVLYSRWWSLPFATLGFISMLMVVAAAAVGTAMSLVFKYALTSQTDLNVGVEIGTKMMAFMWIAAGFTFLAAILHSCLGCWCTSRRDLRTGRKGGRNMSLTPDSTEKPRMSFISSFGRKSTTPV